MVKERALFFIIILTSFSLFLNLFLVAKIGKNDLDIQITSMKDIDLLYTLAKNKSEDLIHGGDWSHNDDEYSERAHELGLYGVGENLSRLDTCDLRVALEKWENSPSHLKNLERDYEKAVLIIQLGEDGKCYGVLEVQE